MQFLTSRLFWLVAAYDLAFCVTLHKHYTAEAEACQENCMGWPPQPGQAASLQSQTLDHTAWAPAQALAGLTVQADKKCSTL
jgi:hypothetical protein